MILHLWSIVQQNRGDAITCTVLIMSISECTVISIHRSTKGQETFWISEVCYDDFNPTTVCDRCG